MLGLATLAVLGMLTNFFLPLSDGLAVIVTVGGVVLGLVIRRSEANGLGWPRIVEAGLLLSSAIVFAGYTTKLTVLYDFDLYHLQTSQWLRTEPLPFGLANLHGRLAFGSSWLTNVTLFRLTGVDLDGALVSTWVPMALTLSWLGGGLVSHQSMKKNPMSSSLAALVLPLLLFIVVGRQVESFRMWTSTDAIGVLLWVLLAFVFLRYLDSARIGAGRGADARGQSGSNGQSVQALGMLLMLTAYTLTVKASLAPVAVLAGAASLHYFYSRGNIRGLSLPLTLSAVTMLVWFFRNLALSGCVVYPAAGACIDSLSWTVDPAQALGEREWTISWARRPGSEFFESNLTEWTWLWDWWLENHGALVLKDLVTSLVVGLALAGVMGLGKGMGKTPRLPSTRLAVWTLIGACILNGVFWFLTAPDPRFATGMFLVAGLLPGTFLLAPRTAASSSKHLIAAWAAPSALLVYMAATLPVGPGEWINIDARGQLESRPTIQVVTARGLKLYKPEADDRCGFSPLPCTPNPMDNLTGYRRYGRWFYSRKPDLNIE